MQTLHQVFRLVDDRFSFSFASSKSCNDKWRHIAKSAFRTYESFFSSYLTVMIVQKSKAMKKHWSCSFTGRRPHLCSAANKKRKMANLLVKIFLLLLCQPSNFISKKHTEHNAICAVGRKKIAEQFQSTLARMHLHIQIQMYTWAVSCHVMILQKWYEVKSALESSWQKRSIFKFILHTGPYNSEKNRELEIAKSP